MYFFYLIEQHSQVFVTYFTGALYVLLNKKKYIYSYLKCIVYDKLLKPRQSFRITLYKQSKYNLTFFLLISVRHVSIQVDVVYLQ